jgi:DNA methylase
MELIDWRSTDRGHPITAAVVAELRAAKIILPAAGVIERAAIAGRAVARRRATNALLAVVTAEQMAKLEHPDALPFFGALQLPYGMPHYLGRAIGGDELAFWFGSPIAWAAGRRVVPGRGPAAQPIHRPNNGHPNSRAQIHIDWLVGWCSDDGQAVCDPFMGSGTTGVACIKLGRPFIGIEIDPRYFDLACRRIDDALRQGDLFSPRTLAPDIDTPRLF